MHVVDEPEKYAEQFYNAAASQLLGEASPWYLLNDQTPSRILKHNQNVKIIIILRNPSDVAFANFLHQIRDKDESLSLRDMDEFLEPARYLDDGLHPFCDHLKMPKYSLHLPAFLDAFPKENLHLVIYEEFREDRVGTVAELFDFLGLDRNVDIDVKKKINVSGTTRSNTLQSLIKNESFLKSLFRFLTTKKYRNRTRSKIETLNTGAKPELEEPYRKRLDALYSEDILYVENILGRPIPSWHSLRPTATS